jgi:hypothetical protein
MLVGGYWWNQLAVFFYLFFIQQTTDEISYSFMSMTLPSLETLKSLRPHSWHHHQA